MKKLLIATAALAMVAGTVQAQSTVTVYGAVGASNNSYKTDGANVAAQFQNQSQDFLGTTNLGFTGTEDLGGGNKAFFRLEGDLSMSGNLGGTVDNQLFNRHAHVGIESAKFGTVSIGRQNDSIKDLEGLGQTYNLSDNLHMNTQVGDRYAQIYKYATPTFNGLKASYSYSNGADNTGNATADGAKTLNSYAVTYAMKNYNFGIGKGTVTQVGQDDLETTFFGARATFGAVTVGAHYAQNEQGALKANQTMVSVNYNMGAIDLKAHYVKDDADGTAGLTKKDGDGYGLMAVYNLSKRTAAYVGYADYDKDGGNSGDQKVTTVGVFHKF
jgi:predicted porin